MIVSICKRAALTTVMLAITRSSAICSGSAPVPLSTLTDKADAIVVAQVIDGSVSTDRIAVNLNVIRVWKGTIQPQTVVTIDTLAARVGPQKTGPVEKDIGMFFLRTSTHGTWALIPPISGFLLDFRNTFIALPRNLSALSLPAGVNASALDKVIAEATAVVQGPFTPTTASINLAAEYRRNPSPAMKVFFAQLRSHPNTRLRVAGLHAGLADGDEKVLSSALPELANLPPFLAAAIVEEIQYRFTSTKPQAVAQLGQLTINPATAPRLRLASAVALARVHTNDTVPYLASLLDNPDPQLRAIAVGGLAKFANNVATDGHHPQPGDWKYRTDETMRNSAMDERLIRENPAILSFWKAWWAEHRPELDRVAP
jgi:hypothetical protein